MKNNNSFDCEEKIKRELAKFRKQLREAVANYMMSEGCGCCESRNHDEYKNELGKLLKVPKYKDGSGYDFSKFRTKK